MATYTCPLLCVGLGPWYLITPVHEMTKQAAYRCTKSRSRFALSFPLVTLCMIVKKRMKSSVQVTIHVSLMGKSTRYRSATPKHHRGNR